MASRLLYVWENGRYDRSRWLKLHGSDGNDIVLDLTDLCQPGRLSGLTNVTLPRHFLRSALANGAVQVSTGRGYFVLRRLDGVLQLEFRTPNDAALCRVQLRADDLGARLAELSLIGNASLR